MAAEAKVSLGLTSIITNDLIDMGFLIRERSMKLKLRREEELMKRWAAAYNSGMQKSKAYYSPGTLYEIGKRISEIAKKYPIKYAFTGSFATDLATQYIRPAEIRAYLSTENDMEKVVSGLYLEIAEIGGNIISSCLRMNSFFMEPEMLQIAELAQLLLYQICSSFWIYTMTLTGQGRQLNGF